MIGIGIDTGGTYTDAVIYDYTTNTVLAKGKALTTKENLSIGIGQALDTLPKENLQEATLISLSTTLATNACVENKGGRAKLILMGKNPARMDWVRTEKMYGYKQEDVLCLDTKGSFDGTIIDEPDWEAVYANEQKWFSDAEAISIAEVNALRNGAICERNARTFLQTKLDIPIILASELAANLNVMERGATALLNAKLLPTIASFMSAVKQSLKERELNIQTMIVRSDGSLMSEHISKEKPVETILSGPAASVLGSRGLTDSQNSLVIDMGGTTTDISIVQNDSPAMSNGIRIGNWQTQISGVFIDTFGLGGDSQIYIQDNEIQLGTRRVQPICVAAKRWPQIKDSLKALVEECPIHTQQLHEFLYLVHEPKDISNYSDKEQEILSILREGPCMLGSGRLDIYNLKIERLENEGIIMRCGLTPTDIMHINGDFSKHDTAASILAARYFLKRLPQYRDTKKSLQMLCDTVYDRVKKKLFSNIVRVLISNKYPDTSIDENLINSIWDKQKDSSTAPFFKLDFSTKAALVGIGAPIHIFLPDVAKALNTCCIIPPHAEVANAVGAIIADITAKSQVRVTPNYCAAGLSGYTVNSSTQSIVYDELEDAIECAKKIAIDEAIAEARRRGALGELKTNVSHNSSTEYDKGGIPIDLGTLVVATASGKNY